MNYKIWIAGIWGEPIFNAFSGLQKYGHAEVLKNDFINYENLRKVYRFINHRLGTLGWRVMNLLMETSVFDKRYKLSECNFSKYDENYIVIVNSALKHYYSNGFFKRLRSKYSNIKIILYIVDPMPDGLWPRIEKMKGAFDKIVTAHPYNSNKYGFEYLPYIYTKPDIDVSKTKVSSDLYFCGVIDEYRYHMVCEILNNCKKNDVCYDMNLFKAENFPQIDDANVSYGLLSYNENIQCGMKSNCILEIVRKDFVGFTQRYYEAVVFNKKLLTNNPGIMEMPYYNPDYMQYFEKVEDINWQWIKMKDKIDYNYKGDFQPDIWEINLFRIIKNRKSAGDKN